MTEFQVIDQLLTNVEADVTDESKFDRDFIAANLYTVRGMAIQQFFQKYKRISPLCLQTLNLEYDINLQDDVNNNCITKYNLPQYIQLDARVDGVTFIGNSENKSFRRIKTRGELATLKKHTLLSPDNGKYIAVLTDNGFAELHATNKIKELIVALCLFNPNDDPSYNSQVDNFPVSQDLITTMTDLAMKLYFNRIGNMPIDNRSNKNNAIPMPSR